MRAPSHLKTRAPEGVELLGGNRTRSSPLVVDSGGARTRDLRVAGAALFRLSYGPIRPIPLWLTGAAAPTPGTFASTPSAREAYGWRLRQDSHLRRSPFAGARLKCSATESSLAGEPGFAPGQAVLEAAVLLLTPPSCTGDLGETRTLNLRGRSAAPFRFGYEIVWCSGEELHLHGSPHQLLRLARLLDFATRASGTGTGYRSPFLALKTRCLSQ